MYRHLGFFSQLRALVTWQIWSIHETKMQRKSRGQYMKNLSVEEHWYSVDVKAVACSHLKRFNTVNGFALYKYRYNSHILLPRPLDGRLNLPDFGQNKMYWKYKWKPNYTSHVSIKKNVICCSRRNFAYSTMQSHDFVDAHCVIYSVNKFPL